MKKNIFWSFLLLCTAFNTQAQPDKTTEEWRKKPLYTQFPSPAEAAKVYRLQGENVGKIDFIGTFQNLHSLYLWGNDWDYELDKLPEGFYQLKNLREFGLFNTNVAVIDAKIAQLQNLEVLALGSNRTDSLPNEIAQLPKLRELSITQIIPYIPPIAGLEKLTIDLYNSEAKVPQGLDKLLNLRDLTVKGYGSLDYRELLKNIRNLPKLRHLKWQTTLDEEALPELKNLTRLQTLELSGYLGSGKWLSFLVNLESLTILHFYPNDAPAENYLKVIYQLPFLQHFATTFRSKYLADYQKFKKLELFFDNETHLSNELLDNLLTIKGLYKIHLYELPPNIGKLTQVEELDLTPFRYRLSAAFVNQLAQMNSLKKLVLNTGVLDKLMPEFANLKSLKMLDIYDYSQNLSAIDRQKFRDLLPNCEIRFLP
jgi:Leucine-rich repeat (LRR) protein